MLAEERSVVSGFNYLAIDLNSHSVSARDLPIAAAACWRPTTVIIGLYEGAVMTLPSQVKTLLPFIDVVADTNTPEFLLDTALTNLAANPVASTTLIQLLRQSQDLTVEQALIAESLAYSSLQHGSEFLDWLRSRGTSGDPSEDKEPTVLMQRDDGHLTISLNRPAKHNAFSAAMRDGLTQALQLASSDSAISKVTLRGTGPSFCAGGDLYEFGQARDAALAHVTRTTRSPGRLIYGVCDKTIAHLHGACIGAGIEMTAFAGHLIAAQGTTFALPEVGFGLVPGAGGTVSMPRRIGRQRTALLALSGQPIDAGLAHQWGLVDAVE